MLLQKTSNVSHGPILTTKVITNAEIRLIEYYCITDEHILYIICHSKCGWVQSSKFGLINRIIWGTLQYILKLANSLWDETD